MMRLGGGTRHADRQMPGLAGRKVSVRLARRIGHRHTPFDRLENHFGQADRASVGTRHAHRKRTGHGRSCPVEIEQTCPRFFPPSGEGILARCHNAGRINRGCGQKTWGDHAAITKSAAVPRPAAGLSGGLERQHNARQVSPGSDELGKPPTKAIRVRQGSERRQESSSTFATFGRRRRRRGSIVKIEQTSGETKPVGKYPGASTFGIMGGQQGDP